MSAPLILAFDTSAAHCAACLLNGPDVLAARHAEMSKGQAEHLMPMLEDLLAEANTDWGALTGLGVGVGPGNFTGIRISVAAARGLALSLGIKAVGVPNLEAQAVGLEGKVVSSSDARQGKLYVDQVTHGQGLGPQLCTLDALPNGVPARAEPYCVGFMADEIAAQTGGRVAASPYPVAEGIARLAQRRLHSSTTRPAPLYVRPPDAAPPRDPAPKILT